MGRGGTEWYRIREPLRALRGLGHTTTIGAALFNGGDLRRWDALLTRALHDRWNSDAWWKLKEMGRHVLVYDLDDDIWNWNEKTEQYRYWNEKRLWQAEQNIIIADVVTTPSKTFAEYLSRLNKNVVVVPNTVPRWLTKISLPPRDSDVFVIGWEGAPHHVDDLELLWGPLFRFMSRHRDTAFWVWGPARENMAEYIPGWEERIRYTPWIKDVSNYYRSLDMDVCLAPLLPTAFNETKSAIRVQEHSALGIPVIASDSPAYHDYLQPGINGLFARTEREWEDHLELLWTDAGLRRDMGKNGRAMAAAWTTEALAPLWEAVMKQEAMV